MSAVANLRAAATGERPLAEMKPKEQISYLLNQKKHELAKMLPKTLSIERLLKVAQIAATTTPALAKCDVPSLVGAIGQCAQMGLEPNTVLGHAYLVPFNVKRKDAQGRERWVNSVQVVIGYKGLIDLARRSGQIVSIAAHEVCANDKFELVYGLDEKLNHTPAMGERGDVIGFYAVAKLKDGGHCFEFMSRKQVDDIMRATQSKGGYGPWKDHFVEMGRKTVIRRLAKYLPLSIEFASAVALDAQADAGRDQQLEAIDGEFVVPAEDAPAFDDNDAAPALEHAPSETLPTSTGRQREAEPIESRAAPAPAPAAKRADDAPPPAVDLASVLRNIDAARTEQELEDAGVLIGELPNEAERASAGDAYRERMDALRAPRQPAGRSRAARGAQQSFDAE